MAAKEPAPPGLLACGIARSANAAGTQVRNAALMRRTPVQTTTHLCRGLEALHRLAQPLANLGQLAGACRGMEWLGGEGSGLTAPGRRLPPPLGAGLASRQFCSPPPRCLRMSSLTKDERRHARDNRELRHAQAKEASHCDLLPAGPGMGPQRCTRDGGAREAAGAQRWALHWTSTRHCLHDSCCAAARERGGRLDRIAGCRMRRRARPLSLMAAPPGVRWRRW